MEYQSKCIGETF